MDSESPLAVRQSRMRDAVTLALLRSSVVRQAFTRIKPASIAVPAEPLPTVAFVSITVPSLLPLSVMGMLGRFPRSFPVAYTTIFLWST